MNRLWCSFCTPPEIDDLEIEDELTRTFAQWKGHCPACDRVIEPGDEIFLVDGVWIDKHCVPDALESGGLAS